MTDRPTAENIVSLEVKKGLWSRFFTVAPLVIVGTREGNSYDLAPKHMVTPLSWEPYFGFVCTRRHATFRNATKAGFFTVTFPKPSQVLLTSLTAQPRRGDDREKPVLDDLTTFKADVIDGVFLEDGYLFLECKVDRVVDGFGKNSLVIGYVMAAHVDEAYVRKADVDDARMIAGAPLLAYLNPGRYAEITKTHAFPFPEGFER